jgi:hypothetical protein
MFFDPAVNVAVSGIMAERLPILYIAWRLLSVSVGGIEPYSVSSSGPAPLGEVIPGGGIGTFGILRLLPSFYFAHLWLRHIAAVLLLSIILGFIGVGEIAGMDHGVWDAHVVHRRL